MTSKSTTTDPGLMPVIVTSGARPPAATAAATDSLNPRSNSARSSVPSSAAKPEVIRARTLEGSLYLLHGL